MNIGNNLSFYCLDTMYIVSQIFKKFQIKKNFLASACATSFYLITHDDIISLTYNALAHIIE